MDYGLVFLLYQLMIILLIIFIPIKVIMKIMDLLFRNGKKAVRRYRD